MPNVIVRPPNRAGVRHHERIVGVHDNDVGRRRALENLGLGVGEGLARREVPEMRVADVGPHANLGLGDPDEQAELARVVHPEFHDRDVGSVPQLEQRERQPEVVVEIALVPHDPEALGQQRRDRFLRRRLAGAAGDGDHRRRGFAADDAREILQCRGGVRDLDEDGISGRAGARHCSLLTRPRGA